MGSSPTPGTVIGQVAIANRNRGGRDSGSTDRISCEPLRELAYILRHRPILGGTLRSMSTTSNLSDLQEQRTKAAADLATIDHAIASVKALEHSNMIDAPCPHCDYVVEADGGMTFHMRDGHPNPRL